MPNTDPSEAFKLQYRIMKLEAAWPEENPTICYTIRRLVSFMLLTTLFVTMLIQAYVSIENPIKLSDILYMLMTVITNVIKYSSLYLNRKDFIYMVNLLKNPIFLSYPEDLDYIMKKSVTFLRILVSTFAFFIFLCVFLIGISPIIDKTPLPFPFPYDLGKFRFVLYALQVIGIGLTGYNNSYLDTLPPSFISIANTQMTILANKITRIREEYDDKTERDEKRYSEINDEDVIKKLKECVLHHKAIIEYVEYIDKVFSFSTFVQFFGSAIIICNTLFRFILVPIGSSQFFMLVVYMGLMFSELFMFCWFGNDIIWNSVNIGYACYSFKWYYCGSKVRKYLYIIMERSKRPLKITAFKFSTLSLTAFTSIMQWSYSYFALMMRLYKK